MTNEKAPARAAKHAPGQESIMGDNTTNHTDRLPRADAAEKYLLTCLVGWPERTAEILPLVEPSQFFDPLHQKLWRMFRTQSLTGDIDVLAAGREHDCCAYLLELGYDMTTTAHAPMMAKCVREAARARRLHHTLHDAANELLRGRPVDSVVSLVNVSMESMTGAVA